MRRSSSNISPGEIAVVTDAFPLPSIVLLNSPSHCDATDPRSAMTCSCTGNVYAVWSSPSYMMSSLACADGGAAARKERAAGESAYPASAARRVKPPSFLDRDDDDDRSGASSSPVRPDDDARAVVASSVGDDVPWRRAAVPRSLAR